MSGRLCVEGKQEPPERFFDAGILHRLLSRLDDLSCLCLVAVPAISRPGSGCVARNFHCRHLVIATDILGASGRDAGDPGFLPRRSLGNPDERGEGIRDGVGIEMADRAGAIPELSHRPVVRGPQPPCFADGRMRIGIITDRKRANQNFLWVIRNGFWKIDHAGRSSIQQSECVIQDPALESRIVRYPQGSAEGKFTKESARRGGAVYLLPDGAQGDGRDTGSFEDVSQRTNCTRAQRSDRGE